MKKYQDSFTVKTYECDSMDRMKADYVLKHMQETANSQMSAEGVPYDSLLEKGIVLVINRMDMEFHRPIMKYQPILVESWPCTAKGATLPRKYVIKDCQGNQLAKGLGQWSLVDIQTKKILHADAVDFSSFTTEEGNKDTCERFKIPPHETLELLSTIEIRYNDVDRNGHMNNTNYLRLVQDYIPELPLGGFVKYARIHFAKECVLGEKITLYICKENDEHCDLLYYFNSVLDDGTINCQIKIGISIEK